MTLLLCIITLCVITIVIDLSLIVSWFFTTGIPAGKKAFLPKVSILVAARNEESNIRRCLQSLTQLSYPKDNMEILVGDDASDDDTFKIAKDLAGHYGNISIHQIKGTYGNARGKANVLAQLARKAKGDFFFITDADIAVPRNWIQGMLLGQRTKKTGIVTGVTQVQNDVFQNIDWIFAIGMVKVITDLGQPVTAMGNNMYITREAYEAVGGYEAIPFSVTEDFELFKQVRAKEFNVVQLFDKEVLATSRHTQGVIALLNQRKRWISGAVQLPWPIVSLLTFQAVYYPGTLILFFLNIKAGVVIYVVKLILQSVFIAALQKKLGQKISWIFLFFYEIYSLGLSLAGSLYFLLPGKIKWKGRKY